MKINKITIISAVLVLALTSCKKDHYDTSNVHGVNAEGEMMLPIGSTSMKMMDMMERFHIDSLVSCHDDGSLYYGLFYDAPGVVKGSELLKFKDLNYSEHVDLSNFFQFDIPNVFDTVVKFDLPPLHFESDYLDVKEAWMRSGVFDFNVSTNIDGVQRIVVRSPDIKDADGNEMAFDFAFFDETFSIDLAGLRYETEVPNQIRLGFDIYVALTWTGDPDFYVDIDIHGKELALREMSGIVRPYVVAGTIDTTLNLFPTNIAGQLNVNDARLRISERNSFDIDAELRVDTALVLAEGFEPYSLFEPLPFIVPIRMQPTMAEVRNLKFDATVHAHGGRVHSAYYFTLCPYGTTEASVADTCDIDVQLNVDIPFAFKVDDVQYVDTIDITLKGIDMPDLIKKLTIDLNLNSTLPLNLDGWFYLYDSQTDMITDTLNPEGHLITASFNGLPTSTTISVEITEDRLENVFRSDRIIARLVLDTQGRNVQLNADQELGISAKAKVEYDGIVELEK